MKKLFYFGLLAVGITYAYSVYASSNSVRMPECTTHNVIECQKWQVTPNGAGIILEKGKNIAINDEEDPQ